MSTVNTIWLNSLITHTHTHTHTYIYIYLAQTRIIENCKFNSRVFFFCFCLSVVCIILHSQKLKQHTTHKMCSLIFLKWTYELNEYMESSMSYENKNLFSNWLNRQCKKRKIRSHEITGTSQVALVVKKPCANAGDLDTGSIPRLGNPCRRKWQPTPVFFFF